MNHLGPLIQDILRTINCMEKKDFIECFTKDSMGTYLWDKFVNVKDADVFEFFCYLDPEKAQVLVEWCMREMERQRPTLPKKCEAP